MNGGAIVVLGGSGFVGRHLGLAPVADGNRVVVPPAAVSVRGT